MDHLFLQSRLCNDDLHSCKVDVVVIRYAHFGDQNLSFPSSFQMAWQQFVVDDAAIEFELCGQNLEYFTGLTT